MMSSKTAERPIQALCLLPVEGANLSANIIAMKSANKPSSNSRTFAPNRHGPSNRNGSRVSEPAVVVTVTVAVEGVVPYIVTKLGLIEHVASAGASLQASETV